ncbi:unnamed protein product [Moneuplotes crassus]|uniref:FYVE-type domain-containing protein n=1 Tax=Euplotes crassus TaxID=5936 RepID=A0AAD1UJE3_EUPCR|nr:unnamed protein product [Moneuplotes crassus]
MEPSRHSQCKKPDPIPVIKRPTPYINLKNNEKFLKKKEIERKYSKIGLHRRSTTSRKLSSICKDLEKENARIKANLNELSDPDKAADLSTQTGTKKSQKQDEENKINKETDEKDDEIENLKSQLQSQIQINKDTKTFLTKETQKYQHLVRRLNDYVESNKDQFDDDSHIIQSTSDDLELILRSGKNDDFSSTFESKSHRNHKRSHSDIVIDDSPEKEEDHGSNYDHVQEKVDEIIKLNQMLKTQLKIEKKRQTSSERRISQIEKISERDLSEEENGSNESPYPHERSNTSSGIKRNSLFLNPQQIDGMSYATNLDQPGMIVFTPTSSQGGQPFFVQTLNSTQRNPREQYKKFAGTFNHNAINRGRQGRNMNVHRTFNECPSDYGYSVQDSDISITMWEEDDEVNSCNICKSTFWLLLRKHHCRVCGKIFCSGCSRYSVIINGHKRRACKFCKDDYDDLKKSML